MRGPSVSNSLPIAMWFWLLPSDTLMTTVEEVFVLTLWKLIVLELYSVNKYVKTLSASINQSINAWFLGRRYTTRPGAPAGSVKSTIKKYILESFSKCTGISNIMKVGSKSVPGGWTGVEEATFTKSCSCSWQNVGFWASGPQSVSAAGCRNRGNTFWKVFCVPCEKCAFMWRWVTSKIFLMYTQAQLPVPAHCICGCAV